MGLNGSPVLALSGRVYRLGTYGAVIAPPNSEHVNMNGSLADRSTFIEFQPVVRRDWFPPYPSFASAASPSPIAVSRDMRVFENFDPSSDGWTVQADGARSKSLSGQTVQLTVWDLSSPTASATVNPAGTRSEQFVYVFDGAAQSAGMSEGRVMAAQTLAVISQSAQALQLRSVGKVRTTVGVFEVK